MKAALIGAGQIARQHLACLKEMPGVELAAVCDLSRSMAESAAERFGVGSWHVDHREMLETVRPDVVHVTTPPNSHHFLALAALEAGAHVVLEKPATATFAQLEELVSVAEGRGRSLVEDYNYLFNGATRKVLDLVESGEFGDVTHVEVFLCLDIVGEGSPFADPNAPHPILSMAGGAIADFLTHLASLAHAFVGPHRKVATTWAKRSSGPLPSDEFRALVDAEHGTASLAFSAHSQPDAFWLRVYGTKMQAVADLFETRLTIRKVRGGPKPLRPLVDSLAESKALRRSAFGTLRRKLDGGPGAYEGLWALLADTYGALRSGRSPAITPARVIEVNRLVADLAAGERQP
jgi:predicted dehydrogenase